MSTPDKDDMRVDFHAMTADEANAINRWEWPDFYPDRTYLREQADLRHFAATDEEGAVIGFCSFQRTPPFPPLPGDRDDVLGIAWGLNPKFIGTGAETEFVRAVVELARKTFPGVSVEAAVPRSNVLVHSGALEAGFVEMEATAEHWRLRARTDGTARSANGDA